jgi:hypothetical protein
MLWVVRIPGSEPSKNRHLHGGGFKIVAKPIPSAGRGFLPAVYVNIIYNQLDKIIIKLYT